MVSYIKLMNIILRRGNMFDKFKDFDEMVTPRIIKALYWIGLIVVAIVSIITLFGSLAAGEFGGAVAALFMAIFGFLMVRIYCELIILGFKGVEYLRNINAKLDALNTRDQFENY